MVWENVVVGCVDSCLQLQPVAVAVIKSDSLCEALISHAVLWPQARPKQYSNMLRNLFYTLYLMLAREWPGELVYNLKLFGSSGAMIGSSGAIR